MSTLAVPAACWSWGCWSGPSSRSSPCTCSDPAPPCGPGATGSGGCGIGLSLSADQARRLALDAQALVGRPPAGVLPLLRRLGGIQLDTISTLARSHEVVAYSRLGPVGRATVEAAFWGTPPQAFEYWAHAACILPLESWPFFAAERRRRALRPHRVPVKPLMKEVRARIAADGPQTVSELGGGRIGTGWWSWSPVKMAVEELYNIGDVVCVQRRAWKRVYDLAERAIPPDLLAQDPGDLQCHVHLVELVAARLGIATERELAGYFGTPMRRATVRAAVEGAGLLAVEVEGWPGQAWAHPAALETLAAGGPRGRHRTTLLSPFDSLLWDRARVHKLFDFRHKLEAYVPAPQRVHGYYTMPLLTGGRLRGRVDPAREGGTLVARQLSVDPGAEVAMATALAEAATWVKCDRVAVPRVEPARSKGPLVAALRDLGAA